MPTLLSSPSRASYGPSTALVAAIALLFASKPALAADATDSFSRSLSHGPVAAAASAFLGGLLVSLTPCVYPMVAVTVSVFGAKKTNSRWHGIGLSSAFVLGMIVMFVALGLVAAFTGTLFGSALQNRWVVLGISALFVVMAFSMFGAFELSLPSGLLNRLATVGGIGFRGAFLLGLVSGIVASPCTGPVLTGILAWIATTRDLWLGSLAMTAFALGLGVPFFAVGAFALSLPKSGRWMMTVKTVLGTVLLIVAVYFVGTTLSFLPRAVPFGMVGWLWALGFGLSAGVISWLSTRFAASGKRVLQAIGVLLFVASGFFAITKVTRTEESLAWEHLSVEVAQARARRDNRPLLVDFTAAWCGACKELDRLTFASSAVKSEAQRFLTVKIDATHDDDPAVSRSLELLSVKGLPTVVLIDSTGHEVKRFTDFVPEGPFVEALRAVR